MSLTTEVYQNPVVASHLIGVPKVHFICSVGVKGSVWDNILLGGHVADLAQYVFVCCDEIIQGCRADPKNVNSFALSLSEPLSNSFYDVFSSFAEPLFVPMGLKVHDEVFRPDSQTLGDAEDILVRVTKLYLLVFYVEALNLVIKNFDRPGFGLEPGVANRDRESESLSCTK